MKWYNEPAKHDTGDGKTTVSADAATDYWRITHYGLIRDNGPFYYDEVADNFEAVVKISGKYLEQYHQAGLMIRSDEKNWIKAGIEFANGRQNISAVVTHETSDWSVLPIDTNPKSVWLKMLRKDDFVEISYSFDEQKYEMVRLAYFEPGIKVMIGMYAAAPGRESFEVEFENFKTVGIS